MLFVGNLILIYVILAHRPQSAGRLRRSSRLRQCGHVRYRRLRTGLLQVDLGLPFWLALPGGALMAMLVGTTMALPALRLSGIYLALATLGFAQFTQWVFLNWESVTFGAGGFRVPNIDFGPLPVRPEYGIYYVSWAVSSA